MYYGEIPFHNIYKKSFLHFIFTKKPHLKFLVKLHV